MTNKFTPGPWYSRSRDDAVFVPLKAIYCERIGFQIGFVNTDLKSIEAEAEANARLIAAAPDLLEALEYVMDRLVDRHETDEAAQKARAAIAKATGGQA